MVKETFFVKRWGRYADTEWFDVRDDAIEWLVFHHGRNWAMDGFTIEKDWRI